MPRFIQFPSDYDTRIIQYDDGYDFLCAVVVGLFLNTVGAALAIFVWFLWSAA